MKYLIDTDTNTVHEAHTQMAKHEECPYLEPARRIMDEIEGWKGYKKLAGEPGTPTYDKYAPVCSQEFQHALLAMSDLIDALKAGANAEEQVHLQRFTMSVND